MKIENRLIKKIDFVLIAIVLIICAIGIVAIGSATYSLGSERFIRVQIISIFVGLLAMGFILLIDYNILARAAIPIYILSNAMLVAVLLFGTGEEQWGANRWLRIGGFGFQPAAIVKIGMIICLAKIIDDHKESIHRLPVLIKIVGFIALPASLILVQPDLGTAIAFGAFAFGMLFVAGLKIKHIIIAGVVCLLSTPLIWMGLKTYQRNRILVFLNPELDPLGKGYQILQSKMAVGSGMIFGQGLFEGPQNQFGFLPEKQTDFIFSVIAEETGFIGVSFLIIMYVILLLKCIGIARQAKDDFGTYLVVGVTFMLAFHIFANIAMTIGLMPITGKPLPLVSYGGTFMLSNMIAIGLVLNVNMRRDKINF